MVAPRRYAADQALAFLRARFDDPTIELEPLHGGNWSTAFGFRDAAELVARFGRHPEDYRKDRWATRWSSAAVPIPAMVDLGPADDDGWWFAVSSRAAGTPLEAATPAVWTTLIPDVIDLIATCASLPLEPGHGIGRWDAIGVAPHPDWPSFLLEITEDGPGHRIAGWRDALSAQPVAQRAFDTGVATLEHLATGLAPPIGVVHADLTNANVLVDRSRISAVLDWGSAMYGDPLHDVAWLTYWQPWQPTVPGAALAEAALADERLTAGGDVARRLRACRLHIGLGHLAYHAWKHDEVWLGHLTALVLADAAG